MSLPQRAGGRVGLPASIFCIEQAKGFPLASLMQISLEYRFLFNEP